MAEHDDTDSPVAPGDDTAPVAARSGGRRAAVIAVVLTTAVAAATAIGWISRGPTHSSLRNAVPSAADLHALGVTALEKLGFHPEQKTPGAVFGGVGANTDKGYAFTLGTDEQPYPQGDYQLSTVCAGTGKIDVQWVTRRSAQELTTAEPKTADHATITCGDDAKKGSLHLPDAGVIGFRVTPDEKARRHSGIAVKATNPFAVAARNAIDTVHTTWSSTSDVSDRSSAVFLADFPAGTYTFAMVCVGAGSLKVRIGIEDVVSEHSLACTSDAHVTRVSVRTDKAGTRQSIDVAPDPTAAATVAGFGVGRLG